MYQSVPVPNRQFQIALDHSRVRWAAADPVRATKQAGCTFVSSSGSTPDVTVVAVPFFGVLHHVLHPSGDVISQPAGRMAHPSVAIALLHYLLTADGTLPAGRWVAFRELPDGLFYAQAFAGHAELLLAQRFGTDVLAYRKAALALGGMPLDQSSCADDGSVCEDGELRVASLVPAADADVLGKSMRFAGPL